MYEILGTYSREGMEGLIFLLPNNILIYKLQLRNSNLQTEKKSKEEEKDPYMRYQLVGTKA